MQLSGFGNRAAGQFGQEVAADIALARRRLVIGLRQQLRHKQMTGAGGRSSRFVAAGT